MTRLNDLTVTSKIPFLKPKEDTNQSGKAFDYLPKPDRLVMTDNRYFTTVLGMIKRTRAGLDAVKSLPAEERATTEGNLDKTVVLQEMTEEVGDRMNPEILALALEMEMSILVNLADSHSQGVANLERIKSRFIQKPGFDGNLFYLVWKNTLNKLNSVPQKS